MCNLINNNVKINQLLNSTCSVQELQHLKEMCKYDIDSKRSYDKIVCLKHLILLLIKRDCLTKLDYIANFLNLEQVNREVSQDIQPNVLPILSSDGIENIDNLIATQIGKKWKDLSRALGIPEGKIDEYDRNWRLEESIREILRYHRSKWRNEWKIKLGQALDTARRRDLRRDMERIIVQFEL